MIKSRPWAIFAGVVAGLAVTWISLTLGGILAIGQAHAPGGGGGSLWDPSLVAALMMAVGLAAVGVVAHPHRWVTLGAAAATTLLMNAAGLIAAFPIVVLSELAFPRLSVSNQSGRVLVVSWLGEGGVLPCKGQNLVVRPGERRGFGAFCGVPLMVFADDEHGVRVFERAYTWDELRQRNNAVTIPD